MTTSKGQGTEADGRYRVSIVGSYGGLNLGDEAILQCILQELRRSVRAEVTVFSRNPQDTLARHQVERAVQVRALSREEVLPEIERLDLLILGGGGILFDAEAHIYLREVTLAQEHGVPVVVYAVSVGPLQDVNAQRQVRAGLSRAAAVTVRERVARQVLEAAGVRREIQVTADPALLLEPERLPRDALTREGLDGNTRLVGMSVREPGVAAPDLEEVHYHALLANAADYMIARFDANVVFVPMEPLVDAQHGHAVIGKMAHPNRAWVLKGEYSPGQILALVGRFEFVVGMRLHFLIFAALQHVPFVALPYADKVVGFLEDLKMPMPPVQQVNAGGLIAHVDYSWDVRRRLRARIERALPRLKERARETNAIAVRVLSERPPRQAVP